MNDKKDLDTLHENELENVSGGGLKYSGAGKPILLTIGKPTDCDDETSGTGLYF